MEEIGRNARKFAEQSENFENYITSIENIFSSIL